MINTQKGFYSLGFAILVFMLTLIPNIYEQKQKLKVSKTYIESYDIELLARSKTTKFDGSLEYILLMK